MSLAICIRCGQGKAGPLTRCLNCRLEPRREDRETQARALLLSDAHLTPERLRTISAGIRGGVPHEFDPDQVAAVAAALPTAGANRRLGAVIVTVTAALALLVAGLVVAAALLVRALT